MSDSKTKKKLKRFDPLFQQLEQLISVPVVVLCFDGFFNLLKRDSSYRRWRWDTFLALDTDPEDGGGGKCH